MRREVDVYFFSCKNGELPNTWIPTERDDLSLFDSVTEKRYFCHGKIVTYTNFPPFHLRDLKDGGQGPENKYSSSSSTAALPRAVLNTSY
jgi:hypothetical protein